MLNESKVMELIRSKQLKKQKGASMIEYALVVAAVAAIAGFVFTGSGTDTGIGADIQDKLESAIGS